MGLAGGLSDCQVVVGWQMIQAAGNEVATRGFDETFEARYDHVYSGAMARACGPLVPMRRSNDLGRPILDR